MKRRYEVLIILFIIVLTIPLARGRGLTETNFSVLGNRGSRRIWFPALGCAGGKLSVFIYRRNIGAGKMRRQDAGMADRPGAGSISVWNWSALSHETGSPYGAYPRISVRGRNHSISVLHQASPYSAGTTIRDRVRIEKWIAISMTAVGVFLYIYVGIISSLLEIYVTLGSCIYLYRLRRKIEKWVCKSKTSMLYY